MERQYNHHHGSVQRKFLPGQQVLVRDYRNNTETWTQGHIVQQIGNVTYNVNVQNSIWVRHSKQLRPSHLPVEIQQDPTIPLNILLDTFDLPQQTPETSQNTEVEAQEPNIQKSVCTRCPTQHLQVDPPTEVVQATKFKGEMLGRSNCQRELRPFLFQAELPPPF